MSDRLQCIDSLRQRRRRGLDNDFQKKLSARIVGQPAAVDAVVPFVQMHQAGLSPEGRPLGVFLLLGPTGTGKTRTVEALAEVLHGSPRNLIRVDCGEYQMEHEVAKLIGAPPGYLGHRETQPVLTQGRLAASTTENCNISVVLFDEIEKAAPSLNRLLLGVLDKATLRLGDNNVVNFERSLIFLTSNLGARGIAKELSQGFGFSASRAETAPQLVSKRLARIAENAARRRFSPEFMNRVDAVVTYEPLKSDSLREILDQQIKTLQEHIMLRLGGQAFNLSISDASRQLLLERGTSPEYGAREIRRTLHRLVTQPIAAL
ncbi:MAG TPA: AAA family ATPase, partial [Bryobacteraceae bacterium]|nr:AAA family ATPase [Bryobacteraceae bacterium]